MANPVSPPVSDELVGAACEAFVVGRTLASMGDGMAHVVAAVRPLIEAEARADERRKIAEAIEASAKIAPEDRYQACTCADGIECHPHACHRVMNGVTKNAEGMWPVQLAGGVWDALEPLIRADAARIARGGQP